ncbi:dihydrofolate reductase [Chromobacterium subtsugae]|uniref:Dihydrofolate reductase n=1 Tax=Chromobacterium subtsugae TaxID=251747 RepID=A0ABS7FEG6_9NEIS|nr:MULTISPECIES: dihydrofolate reductase [Chromobacterium]KUM02126.1 diacylglycerol kinase [Chromobacterium subtsugae]KZE85792.1 diacylglycerol kinase [Chromobacterium sp. F49]MBW7566432.1 dihydrofolate reductase [Chromobacterium subtsugae]MBW8287709.1 dihydrofolate reductase [Chromobacterium subtsugae]WSE91041.1 dihydrofolate reductase [Chromobacterium subtsugae]
MTAQNKPRLTLVAAMASNRTIGVDNQLPWHLPEDLRHFKAATLGKPVIMGRKTWDSIGKPLPGRRNIVVTRQADWRADGAEAAHSLEEALALAGAVEEVCLIGGAELYRQAIAVADRLCLTEIADAYDGDAHFPEFSAADWRQASREEAVSAGGLAYAFVDYLRR